MNQHFPVHLKNVNNQYRNLKLLLLDVKENRQGHITRQKRHSKSKGISKDYEVYLLGTIFIRLHIEPILIIVFVLLNVLNEHCVLFF